MNNILLKERLDIFNDAIKLKRPYRIPTLGNVFSWKVFDSDTKAKLSESVENHEINEKILREHFERYNFDAHLDYGSRNSSNVISKILGKTQHVINDETGAIYALDTVTLKREEYDEFINDSLMFQYTKMMPRKYGNLTYEQFANAAKAFLASMQFGGKMAQMGLEEYSLPATQKGYAMLPIENVFSQYRGIKEFSVDLRRCPGKLDEFILDNEPTYMARVESTLATENPNAIFDIYTAFLCHSVMNNAQFGRFIWSTYRKVIDTLVQNDASVILFIEAETLRLTEFFADIPKGHVCIHVEKDDIFEMRKRLPNICFAGGMPVDLLGNSTKEACLNMAQKLCDELGETGYIFSQNKMMSFPYDGNRENMMAVQEYVLNYRL